MEFELSRIRVSRAKRFLVPVVVAAFVLVTATGCDPDPVVQVVPSPSAGGFLLQAVNNNGIAVGVTSPGSGGVYTYNFATNSVDDLSRIPVGPDFPSGGTFVGTNGPSINSSGQVLAAATGGSQPSAIYDPSTGAYTPVPCSTPFGPHALSDSGLVACGTSVYNSKTGVSTPVTSPAGCNGSAYQVNDQVVVGLCSAGDEPYFVTDIATNATAGFGASEGFSDANAGSPDMYSLTNSNWVVLAKGGRASATSAVVDVTGANPQDVLIGGKSTIAQEIYAASDNGRLAVTSSSGGIVVANPATGKMIGLDSSSSLSSPAAFGLNNSGQVVGTGSGSDDQPQAFVASVTMP